MWNVWGFEENKKFFEKMIGERALVHAYLFTGQEMIGKRTFALDLASQNSSNADLLLLGGGGGVTIEQVRNFKKFLSLRPYQGQYKIAILDDAHSMGSEAANALLKILEEPPAHSLIILVTSQPRLLLPTVVSRTMEIKFAPHPREKLIQHLQQIGLNEKQAEFLADFANGQLGLAYRLKEANAFKNIRRDLEEFNNLLKANLNTRLIFAEDLFKEKAVRGPQALLRNWLFYLRSDLSKKLPIKRAKLLRLMLEVNNILSYPQYNHRLAFENLLLSL